MSRGDMDKTSIVSTLPCGCVERFWLFGREIIKPKASCKQHGTFAPRRRSYCWSMRKEQR